MNKELVLSGGGTPGLLLHAGALKFFMDEAYVFDCVAGTSAGAIAAAAYSMDIPLSAELLHFLAKNRLRKIRPSLFPLSFYSNKPFLNLFEKKFNKPTQCDLYIVTSNLTELEATTWFFPKGSYVDPKVILASMSIPILFPPVEIAGSYHVDGGLCSNTPVENVNFQNPIVLKIVGKYKPKITTNNPLNYLKAIVETSIRSEESEDLKRVRSENIHNLNVYGPTLEFNNTTRDMVIAFLTGYGVVFKSQSIRDYFKCP